MSSKKNTELSTALAEKHVRLWSDDNIVVENKVPEDDQTRKNNHGDCQEDKKSITKSLFSHFTNTTYEERREAGKLGPIMGNILMMKSVLG